MNESGVNNITKSMALQWLNMNRKRFPTEEIVKLIYQVTVLGAEYSDNSMDPYMSYLCRAFNITEYGATKQKNRIKNRYKKYKEKADIKVVIAYIVKQSPNGFPKDTPRFDDLLENHYVKKAGQPVTNAQVRIKAASATTVSRAVQDKQPPKRSQIVGQREKQSKTQSGKKSRETFNGQSTDSFYMNQFSQWDTREDVQRTGRKSSKGTKHLIISLVAMAVLLVVGYFVIKLIGNAIEMVRSSYTLQTWLIIVAFVVVIVICCKTLVKAKKVDTLWYVHTFFWCLTALAGIVERYRWQEGWFITVVVVLIIAFVPVVESRKKNK